MSHKTAETQTMASRFSSAEKKAEEVSTSVYMKWSVAPPSGACPRARVCTAIAGVGTAVYLIGGYGSTSKNVIYKLETQDTCLEWKHLQPLLVPRLKQFPALAGHTCTAVDEEIWIIGGRFTETQKRELKRTSSEIYVFNPSSNTLRREVIEPVRPDFHTPKPRRLHTATFIPRSNSIFIFGGNGEKIGKTSRDFALDDAFLLDTLTKEWKKIGLHGSVPGNRAGHTSVLYPGSEHVFIYGGMSDPPQDQSGSLVTNVPTQPILCEDIVYVCDSRTGKCSQLPTVGRSPGPLSGHTSGVLSSKESNFMYTLGGHREDTGTINFHLLDMDLGIWYQIRPKGMVPNPSVHSASFVSRGNTILLFGGVTLGGIMNSSMCFGKVKHLSRLDSGTSSRVGSQTAKTPYYSTHNRTMYNAEQYPWWYPLESSFEAYKLFIEKGATQYVDYLCSQLRLQERRYYKSPIWLDNIWNDKTEPNILTSPRVEMNGETRKIFQTFTSTGVPDKFRVSEEDESFGTLVYEVTNVRPSMRACQIAEEYHYDFGCRLDTKHPTPTSSSNYEDYVNLNEYLRKLHLKLLEDILYITPKTPSKPPTPLGSPLLPSSRAKDCRSSYGSLLRCPQSPEGTWTNDYLLSPMKLPTIYGTKIDQTRFEERSSSIPIKSASHIKFRGSLTGSRRGWHGESKVAMAIRRNIQTPLSTDMMK